MYISDFFTCIHQKKSDFSLDHSHLCLNFFYQLSKHMYKIFFNWISCMLLTIIILFKNTFLFLNYYYYSSI